MPAAKEEECVRGGRGRRLGGEGRKAARWTAAHS